MRQEVLGWDTDMEHRAPGWDSSHWDGAGGGTGGVKRRQEVSGWDTRGREGTGATKM